MKTPSLLVLLVCSTLVAEPQVGAQEKAEAAPSLYVKKATWPETMTACRARYLAHKWEAPFTAGPWFATHPLKAKNLDAPLFPEQRVDLEARDGQGRLVWTARPGWTDGTVRNLPRKNHASTYLFRIIEARKALEITASFGSDDGIMVWLNSEKILSRDAARGAAPDQDRVVVHLRPGENRLLLKIHNNTGGHAFYFSLQKDPVQALWRRLEKDFPREAAWMKQDLPRGTHLGWFKAAGNGADLSKKLVTDLLEDLGLDAGPLTLQLDALVRRGSSPEDPAWLSLYVRLCRLREARADLDSLDLSALRRAVEHLTAEFPGRYPGRAFLARLDAAEKEKARLRGILARGEDPDRVTTDVEILLAFRREVLLENPLLDFGKILLVKRKASSPKLGLPQNWQGNCSLPRTGYEDELVLLDLTGKGEGRLTPLFKPEKPSFIGDVDLHFDGDRMLFSSIGTHDRWQIFEVKADGTGVRQVTPGDHPDVDNYDACYLPDGRIIFDSTRCFQGIPCVGGADQVANLFLMDASGRVVRQLCFDQDHDWCPTVLNSGRILYTRWEYSDTPHYFSRLLFHMNPDGTGQMEFYGSNSFWPNSLFYARPIPGHPTQVVSIVSGHHGVPRMGELVVLDPARGRFESDGVVQRIPGFGRKVEPRIMDQLVNHSWPKFLHPWPLSSHFFLVACQPAPGALWGVYLVDRFDNLVRLHEVPGHALLEPISFTKRKRPPVLPDRVRPGIRDAVVYLNDVYRGRGLEGVPRGAVKRLRVFEFHYAYNRMGGHVHVGVEGPWDVRRILGTVPVYEDGSASFVVPANTPVAVQPLDGEGKALQVMRSWFTAMPGEVLSCVGCHERQNTVPPVRASLAARRKPVAIEPWRGPARGFSFKREVQPVLDRYCVQCHGRDAVPDFTRKKKNGWNNFTPSYLALHPYVRRPGPESDYHLQRPMEFHADTSELVQMLKKGHHGVHPDEEAWDRLVTWIDLNVPDHGTWSEHKSIPSDLHRRRLEMRKLYANRPEDPEALPDLPPFDTTPVKPGPALKPVPGPDACKGWPFGPEEAARKRTRPGLPGDLTLDLGGGVKMAFVLVPPGAFLMGSSTGASDEAPRTLVRIGNPFYMSRYEVTRAQFNRFDPTHHNGYLDQRHKDHTLPGYSANEAGHPAIRVTWTEARAFCDWLGKRTSKKITLPTEAEWEWACRAGRDTPFHFGRAGDDFSRHANLADASVKLLAVTGVNPKPIPNPSRFQDYLPRDGRFNDGQKIMARVGAYRPNAFGLHDMHGNVWEWTLSAYRPYPYDAEDGRNKGEDRGLKVVRGGSWRDRPGRATASYRLAYRHYQPVFNVGVRVVLHPEIRRVARTR